MRATSTQQMTPFRHDCFRSFVPPLLCPSLVMPRTHTRAASVCLPVKVSSWSLAVWLSSEVNE